MNAVKKFLSCLTAVISVTLVMSTRAFADDCTNSWIDCFGTIAGEAAAATGIGVAVAYFAFGGGVLPKSPPTPDPPVDPEPFLTNDGRVRFPNGYVWPIPNSAESFSDLSPLEWLEIYLLLRDPPPSPLWSRPPPGAAEGDAGAST